MPPQSAVHSVMKRLHEPNQPTHPLCKPVVFMNFHLYAHLGSIAFKCTRKPKGKKWGRRIDGMLLHQEMDTMDVM